MTRLDENGPVVLTSVPSELMGMLLVGRLEGEGIMAKLAGGGLAGFRAETPVWVQVLVARRDLDRAKELLAEWKNKKREEGDDDDLTAEAESAQDQDESDDD